MKKKVYLIALFIITLTLCACSSTGTDQLSKREKIEDFEYLYKTIEEGYPYLDVNKRLNNVDWIANKSEYKKRIKQTKSDEEFKREMGSIISELNNDHTKLVLTNYEYTYLKDIYSETGWYDFFDDDTVKDRYENLTYRQPSGIGGETGSLITRDIIENKVGYMYLPQMSMNEEDLTPVLDYIKTLTNHDTLIIDIRGNSGGSDGYWMNIIGRLLKDKVSAQGYMLFKDQSEVISNYAKKREIKLSSINDLSKEVKNNAPKEINEKNWHVNIMTKEIPPNESIGFGGKIYLLVDQKVYSSAESFSIFCKDANLATIIGEKTGGDGGGYDPVLFNLKNSGLIVRMSSDMYLTKDGTCNEEFKTTPDYIIENTKRSIDYNEDACIQKVLELEGLK